MADRYAEDLSGEEKGYEEGVDLEDQLDEDFFDSDGGCNEDDIILDEDFDKDFGGDGIASKENLKSSKSDQPQSKQPEKSQSEQQTQTEKSKTQTTQQVGVYKRKKSATKKKKKVVTPTQPEAKIEYTHIVELPPVTRQPSLIILGYSPQLPEDRFIAEILKYELKGKGHALYKHEIKELVQLKMAEMISEAIYEEGIKTGARKAGITIETYKKLIAKQLMKMNEWVGEDEHKSMKASTSGTKGLRFGCDISTLPDELAQQIAQEEDETADDTAIHGMMESEANNWSPRKNKN